MRTVENDNFCRKAYQCRASSSKGRGKWPGGDKGQGGREDQTARAIPLGSPRGGAGSPEA